MEKKLKEQERQQKKELKAWDKQIKVKEEQFAALQRELKEKEQENRISKLKIKEMKRLIKHNQLKPLRPPTLSGLKDSDKAVSENLQKEPVQKQLQFQLEDEELPPRSKSPSKDAE